MSTTRDPTVADVIKTMTKNERIALYNIMTETFNKRFHSSKVMVAASIIVKMSENKKRVAYYLIGLLVETKKSRAKIIDELQELLF